MPSPGISFGDLAVFIAVLVIVAVFLMAVRSFIKRVETPDESAGPQRRSRRKHAPKNPPCPRPKRSLHRTRLQDCNDSLKI